jgi:hypothetical protein
MEKAPSSGHLGRLPGGRDTCLGWEERQGKRSEAQVKSWESKGKEHKISCGAVFEVKVMGDEARKTGSFQVTQGLRDPGSDLE